MPLTDQEKPLFALARERINNGQLPDSPPPSLAAGSGMGGKCSLCNATIKLEDIEYEFIGGSGQVRVRFHMRCYALWQLAADDRNRITERGTDRSPSWLNFS